MTRSITNTWSEPGGQGRAGGGSGPRSDRGGDEAGSLLVLGWGSTYGAIQGAVRRARSQGLRVGHAHLRYLNPFPKNLESVMSRFEKVLVPELNMGQLAFVLQGRFVRPVESLTKIQGKPFTEVEVLNRILELAPGSNGKGGAA
ncbi:MAG: hypothetical protein R3E12_03640 [Candidatus Eisenbacteria bacterium]